MFESDKKLEQLTLLLKSLEMRCSLDPFVVSNVGEFYNLLGLRKSKQQSFYEGLFEDRRCMLTITTIIQFLVSLCYIRGMDIHEDEYESSDTDWSQDSIENVSMESGKQLLTSTQIECLLFTKSFVKAFSGFGFQGNELLGTHSAGIDNFHLFRNILESIKNNSIQLKYVFLLLELCFRSSILACAVPHLVEADNNSKRLQLALVIIDKLLNTHDNEEVKQRVLSQLGDYVYVLKGLLCNSQSNFHSLLYVFRRLLSTYQIETFFIEDNRRAKFATKYNLILSCALEATSDEIETRVRDFYGSLTENCKLQESLMLGDKSDECNKDKPYDLYEENKVSGVSKNFSPGRFQLKFGSFENQLVFVLNNSSLRNSHLTSVCLINEARGISSSEGMFDRVVFVFDRRLVQENWDIVEHKETTINVGRRRFAPVYFLMQDDLKYGISRQHACIDFSDLSVCDLDSRNGTFVNDIKLKKGVPTELSNGDYLVFSGGPSVCAGKKVLQRTQLRYRVDIRTYSPLAPNDN